MAERFDVDSIRLPREPGAILPTIVDALLPGSSIFHLLAYTPEQCEDLFVVMVDGESIVRFELPREPGSAPQEVMVSTLTDYRQQIGQGRFRKLLDAAASDARDRLMPVRP